VDKAPPETLALRRRPARPPRMLARTRMKAKREELAEALDGMFDDHHGELAGMLLDPWGSNPRRRL